MVCFKKANVVAMGEAFVSNDLGGPDLSNNGTMTGVIDEMRTILSVVPEDAKVIPGHGAQGSMKDVRQSLKILQGMSDAVQQPIRSGKIPGRDSENDCVERMEGSFRGALRAERAL
jgi:cyclase